jgi:two-component system response regulator FixJ
MPSDSLVHVIDDDDAARQSLDFMLRAARFDVRTYDSATAFLKSLPDALTGCIITDVRMPGLSGLDLLKRLHETGAGIPVIVMTGHGDIPLAVEAMKFGAVDFFEKPFDDEAMIAAVRTALGRGRDELRRQEDASRISARLLELSNRERQVLEGLVSGRANKVIAFELGISPRTVEIYRANLMTKMGASSLSDLVRMALMTGVLGPSQKSEATKK